MATIIKIMYEKDKKTGNRRYYCAESVLGR